MPPPGPDESHQRWCVEFGAWDGHYLSNTYNLIQNSGEVAISISPQ
jgi:hypothetical protein